jgi:hypothetical protein
MEIKNRKIEDSIEVFYSKCAKLNIPSSVMPDHQFLKRYEINLITLFFCLKICEIKF